MKFQKVLKEINNLNHRKLVDEALLTDIIDRWPYLVVNQYKFDHATDPKEKAGYENIINKFLMDITTFENKKWVGDLKKDFVDKINRPYNNVDAFTIKDGKINIKYEMNNEWVSYLTSPAAATLIRRISNLLLNQKQKEGISNQQPVANQKPVTPQSATNQQPVANPQTPSAMPTAADRVLNKLSTI